MWITDSGGRGVVRADTIEAIKVWSNDDGTFYVIGYSKNGASIPLGKYHSEEEAKARIRALCSDINTAYEIPKQKPELLCKPTPAESCANRVYEGTVSAVLYRIAIKGDSARLVADAQTVHDPLIGKKCRVIAKDGWFQVTDPEEPYILPDAKDGDIGPSG